MVLEPWIIEAALALLSKKLSRADQRIIVKAARTPHKVKWPDWWSGASFSSIIDRPPRANQVA
jgi:hypothetical protein